MDDHRHAVLREVDIEFDPIHALAGGKFKRRKSVLGRLARGSAVTDVERGPEERRGLKPPRNALEERSEDCHRASG